MEETRSFVRRELIFRKDHYELCDKISGIVGNIETYCKNWSIECVNKYLVFVFLYLISRIIIHNYYVRL